MTTGILKSDAAGWVAALSSSALRLRGVATGFGVKRTARMLCCALLPCAVVVGAAWVDEAELATALHSRNLPPTFTSPFGTDWLGRGMFSRVLLGLRLSLGVGVAAALSSTILGVGFGVLAGLLGRHVDRAVTWLIDLVMSLPHLVFQILIAFAVGGGVTGVITAVALTHWASLARIVRAEVQSSRSRDFVLLANHLGRSDVWIARHHIMPLVVPQFVVGLVLMFPHAISHEAALSFIGLGLPPHEPSMGIVLAESLRHLASGQWWLAVFPGVALLVLVKSFDVLGEELRCLMTPRMGQDP